VAIIAVTGRKGGIGKSSITANLAAEFDALGHTVAILDTDPQASLVAWAGLGPGLLSRIIQQVDATSPEDFKAKVLAVGRSADRVLIDTQPGTSDTALLAALLADLVLLPAGPSPLDIMAARDALALTRDARRQRGGRKPLIRFVPSRVAHTILSQGLADSLEQLGEKVLPAIGQRVVVADAALAGLTVRERAHSSPAQQEFEALALAIEEVLKR
jgi:chromosome partitioning protein